MTKLNLRFYLSLVYIGIISGLIGTALTHILHGIQHIAFDYGLNGENMSFREGVLQSSAERRWLALTFCGIVVGIGWYSVHRYGKKLLSVKQGLDNPQQGVPFFKTVGHALLQIITVGLGSPLGREVAPREMSVAFGSAWVRKAGLNDTDAKLILACASGAGLTAVYNVPLASTIFILETMVLSISTRSLGAALVTVVLSTCVSRFFLGDLVQYDKVTPFAINTELLIFSAIIGMLIPFVVQGFRRSTQHVPFLQRTDKRIIPVAVLLFSLIGFISIYQPEILGNGKPGNQLTFGEMINWSESLQLMALKWLAVLFALAAGAYGGLITPSMMLGSTFAYSLAIGWNALFPQLSLEGAAIIGACVFLGIMQKMPFTSIVFLLELTRSNAEVLMPLTLAMGAAIATDRLIAKWK
ncbi:chloride channel protein [Actinobacillus succinogenes]|uniref:Chloride channel core n=1 Tax=Actinobacillus succinogenes (strain ATCC 55618 / DSM 22257 / CCUG 43843 / 130Z) TaxID=339671 RepID=A6VKP8_ACTSZ|nr:chloride channel protein [Actinobacillus succinogenes]ABR73545.1 Chloride channel core [Actinobacillus succinogenes 130Z]PHI41222.1 chloride channel protein [Actinobacillus succinogenes]